MAQIEEQLRQEGSLPTARRPTHDGQLAQPHPLHLLVEKGQPAHLYASIQLFVQHLGLDRFPHPGEPDDIGVWDGAGFVEELADHRWTFAEEIVGVLHPRDGVFDDVSPFQSKLLGYLRGIQHSGFIVVHLEGYLVKPR